MKPLTLLPGLFTLASAQYFSPGWTPGHPVPTAPAQSAASPPAPAQPAETTGIPPAKPSFIDNLVTGGPISALADVFGFNLTGTPATVWDERIPLITDANYVDMIVNEQMTPEEEEKRLWFLVITSTAGQPEGISKFVDQSFDAAYNYTLEKGDLEHVRFGRIDYLDVTIITTKWIVWSPPTFVVLKDRGKTLRFYRAGQIRLSDEVLYQFLKEEGWRHKEPWVSQWGPGGDREWLLDHYAHVMAVIYNYLVRVPKWLMYIVSGGLATFIINFLHRDKPTGKDKAKTKPSKVTKQTTSSNPSSSATITPKPEAKTTATSSQKTPNKRRGKK